MKKKLVISIFLFLILGGMCGADENDKLSQVMRVQADKVTVVDSQSRLKILLAVSSNLGKEIVIKPRNDFKESVHHFYKLAERGKTLHSGRFGIGSEVSSIKKAWSKPQGEYKVKNQRMMLYKDRSVTYKYPTKRWKVTEVSCHSFFGSPCLPSMSEFQEGLGKPYKEYNLLQLIEESDKQGINLVKRLQERGITKKTTNIKDAIELGELDIKIVMYKAGQYFLYMTECRIRKDTKFYRSVGVRTDADIQNDPWII